MELPIVSIITPSFNQAKFLERAIESVSRQSYRRIEHIIIDGGSTDGSVDILERNAARLAYWISAPDRGQSHAINMGFERANGEILAWLNADDFYYTDTVQRVVDSFVSAPDTDFLYGDFDWVGLDGKLIEHRREIEFDLEMLAYLFCYVPSTASFFRRTALERSGPLDESLHYVMDLDLFLRMALTGVRFRHIPVTLSAFTWHSSSKSTQNAAVMDAEWRSLVLSGRYPQLRIPRSEALFHLRRSMIRLRRWYRKWRVGSYKVRKRK